MKIKKWLSIVLASVMILSMSITAFAEENAQSNLDSAAVQMLATTYQVTEDEIVHLSENIESALAKYNSTGTTLRAGESNEKVIPISENLRLVISTKAEESNLRTLYRTTISSGWEIENVYGSVILTLTSTGVFERDGSTCTPVDAYGTYEGTVWSVEEVESVLSSAAYSAWVRNSFECECNIGFDLLAVQLFTYSATCTITCDAEQNYSTNWV